MPVGIGKGDFSLDIAAPLATIRVVSGPSRPYAPLADGAVAWRAVSHLSVNYLSLVNSTPQEGAAALRDLLDLSAAGADASARKQIEASDRAGGPVVRRLPPSSTSQAKTSCARIGRGLEIALDVDELAFGGGSAHLLGSVLARFFSRYVSINSFTETVLRSQSRGEINRWMPQWGARPTL
jgi:type VI secretion system protein ImpG